MLLTSNYSVLSLQVLSVLDKLFDYLDGSGDVFLRGKLLGNQKYQGDPRLEALNIPKYSSFEERYIFEDTLLMVLFHFINSLLIIIDKLSQDVKVINLNPNFIRVN